MANNAIVGILRALLTANTAEYQSGMKAAVGITEKTTTTIDKLGEHVSKLTPQAERMAKGFSGDKLLYTANNLTAAIGKVGGATKLTEAEQSRANATLSAAIAKYQALGQAAPAAMIAAEKATRGAAAGTSLLSSTFATLTASFSSALIVNRIVGGIISLGNEAIASAGNLVDLSNKTGLSIDTLQRMSYVATQSGGSLEAFTNASFKLSQTIAGGGPSVSSALRRLGLDLEAVQKLNPDQQWKAVIPALEKLTNEQDRNRIGVLLAGKAYAAVASDITDGYTRIAAEAKTSGDAQVRAIDDAVDAFAAFTRNTTTGFQAAIGSALLWGQALKQAIGELGIFASTSEVTARAQFILNEGLLQARTKDIQLTNRSAAATVDYVQAIKDADLALKGLTAEDRRQLAAALEQNESMEVLTDRFNLSELAIDRFKTKLAGAGKAARDTAKDVKELRTEIEDLRGDVAGVADKLEADFDRITDAEMFDDLRDSIAGVASAMDDVIEKSEPLAVKSELDAERIRQLMAANAPGSGPFKQAAKDSGKSIGKEINTGIAETMRDLPHFLVSSVLHTGSFLNGLKALGVSIADAIAEPLIKQLGIKIAAFFVGGSVAKAAGGGSLLGAILSGLPGVGAGNPTPPANKGQPKGPNTQNPGPGITPIPPYDPTQPGPPAPGVPPTPGGPGKAAIPVFDFLAPSPLTVGAEPMIGAMMRHGPEPAAAGPARTGITVINQFDVNTIDERGVREFLRSPSVTRELAAVFDDNHGFITTRLARAQRGIR